MAALKARHENDVGVSEPCLGHAAETPAKKRYQSPCLTILGDVRDRTLGPSVGIGESGNPLVFKA